MALVEDGSLARSNFPDAASSAGLRFRRADTPIDVRPEGEDIQARLLELETLALENGSSLGSGFAYPITIDLLKAWTEQLDGKGVVLAPASVVTRINRADADLAKSAANDASDTGQSSEKTLDTTG